MKTGSTRIHVVARAGGGWDLRETASGPVVGGASTKGDATTKAELILERARGGEVVVHRADGSVDATFIVPERGPRPKWYVHPGLLGWIVPAGLGLQAVIQLVVGRHTAPIVALWVCSLVLFAVAMVCYLLSRRLDRQRRQERLDARDRAVGH